LAFLDGLFDDICSKRLRACLTIVARRPLYTFTQTALLAGIHGAGGWSEEGVVRIITGKPLLFLKVTEWVTSLERIRIFG